MKISALMKEHIEKSHRAERAYSERLLPESFRHAQELPVLPTQNDWVVLAQPQRLHKVYGFESVQNRNLFIEEIAEAEEKHGHFAKITIEALDVTIEVWTHDLNMVTELDKEYARDCDIIFKDVSLVEFGGF